MSIANLFSFEMGERVFLKVLEHSQSLKTTGLVTNLSPRYGEQYVHNILSA